VRFRIDPDQSMLFSDLFTLYSVHRYQFDIHIPYFEQDRVEGSLINQFPTDGGSAINLPDDRHTVKPAIKLL
jgi:hypothetical protein